MKVSGISSYYQQDALGSTMQLSDDSENVTDTYSYDAWGELLSRTGSTENPFEWIGAWGYYKDQTTGLYYVRARDMRSSDGRWRRPDPLLFVDGPNLYVMYFVPNGVDPSGMQGDRDASACLKCEGGKVVVDKEIRRIHTISRDLCVENAMQANGHLLISAEKALELHLKELERMESSLIADCNTQFPGYGVINVNLRTLCEGRVYAMTWPTKLNIICRKCSAYKFRT